jgi:DNA-directed RNA polymerase subunit H (RpoH/RPB5)
MENQKFKVGQIVKLVRRNIPGRMAGGVFEITRAMPFDGVEVSYRVKAGQENHERAVRESEIEIEQA